MTQAPRQKLTDDDVIMLRNLVRENPQVSLRPYLKKYGVETSTLSKAIAGRSFPHLNDRCAPVHRGKERLPEAMIIEARQLAAQNPKFNCSAHAKKMGIASATLREAIMGITYTRLNAAAPPVHFDRDRSADRAKVRALYEQKVTYRDIYAQTGVSPSIISVWCQDLILARKAAMEAQGITSTNNRSRRRKARTTILTDEDVIAIRQEVKRTGMKSTQRHAKKYGTSPYTISTAISGLTFKHLNAIEAPIPEKLKIDTGRVRTKWVTPEDLVTQAMALLREDPNRWSYDALARWLSEQTGRQYRAPHVSRMFANRDPSLKTVALLKPKRASAASKARKDELRKMRQAEDRLEAWHAAGCPADWVWPET